MPEAMTDDELRKAQEAEYSTFVATQNIDIGGARAFNIGDPVPSSHVDRGIVSDESVAKQSTKAGKAAIEQNPTTGSEG